MDDYEFESVDIESTYPVEEEPAKSIWKVLIVETVQTLVLAGILFFVINALTARIRVDGPSMEPNFVHNNYVVVNKIAYLYSDIERGDVIVFPFPDNQEEDFIKRIIGLPGDIVAVRNGQVYVNDQLIEEPYIITPHVRDYEGVTVPEGTVFVMGDNRNNSSDSRAWGTLNIEDIIGKAVLIYWPATDFGLVEHPDLLKEILE